MFAGARRAVRRPATPAGRVVSRSAAGPALCLVTDRRRVAPDARTPAATSSRRSSAGSTRRIDAGVDLIQIRERDLDARALARARRAALRRARAARETRALLVNDRADVALAAGADGVHLRADGPAVPSACVRYRAAAGWSADRCTRSTRCAQHATRRLPALRDRVSDGDRRAGRGRRRVSTPWRGAAAASAVPRPGDRRHHAERSAAVRRGRRRRRRGDRRVSSAGPSPGRVGAVRAAEAFRRGRWPACDVDTSGTVAVHTLHGTISARDLKRAREARGDLAARHRRHARRFPSPRSRRSSGTISRGCPAASSAARSSARTRSKSGSIRTRPSRSSSRRSSATSADAARKVRDAGSHARRPRVPRAPAPAARLLRFAVVALIVAIVALRSGARGRCWSAAPASAPAGRERGARARRLPAAAARDAAAEPGRRRSPRRRAPSPRPRRSSPAPADNRLTVRVRRLGGLLGAGERGRTRRARSACSRSGERQRFARRP